MGDRDVVVEKGEGKTKDGTQRKKRDSPTLPWASPCTALAGACWRSDV